jgi:arginyl-tRNA--protein-N-Asp/Glu arginylyltransferase
MVFFICYWIANNEKLEYKIPFVFDIYALLASILISIKNLWKKAKEKSVTKESSMKVWENK